MKMMLGNTPVKSLNIHHFEMDTNSATVQPSDLQAGITCFARGQKVTGTGKSFEFAYYGKILSNDSIIIPTNSINVVHISSLEYPVHSIVQLADMNGLNFANGQVVCNLIADGTEHPVTVTVGNNEIVVSCDVEVFFEIFFGKDNYT